MAGAGLVLAALLAGGAWWFSRPNLDRELQSARAAVAAEDFPRAAIHLRNVLPGQPDSEELRLLSAQVNLAEGKPDAAERDLRLVVKGAYQPDQSYPLLARALTEQRKPVSDFAVVDPRALTSAAARAAVLAYRARAQLQAGQAAAAEADLAEAERLAPNEPTTVVTRATLLARQRRLDEAVRLVEQAATQPHAGAELGTLRAMLALRQNHRAEAMAQLEKVVGAAPTQRPPRALLASLLIEDKQLDAARQHIKLLARNPNPLDRLEASILTAKVAIEEGQFSTARDSIAQVLKVAPGHAMALQIAAKAEAALGSHAAAEAHLRKLLAQQPEHLMARQDLAQLLLNQGRTAAADALIAPALASSEPDARTLALAAQAAARAGDYRLAAAHGERAAKLQPDNTELATAAALIHIAGGDTAAGLAELEALSKAHADQHLPDAVLVQTHLRNGQPKRALAAVEALQAKQPAHPITLHLRGAVLRHSGDAAGARAAFERALTLDPKFIASTLSLAELDLQAGEPVAAQARLQAALSAHPKNAHLLSALASASGHAGAPRDQVRGLLEQAQAASPSQIKPRLELIRWHMQGGDLPKAAALAAATTRDFAHSLNAGLLHGRILLMQGDKEQALAIHRKLAGEHRQSIDAQLALAQAQILTRDLAAARTTLAAAKAQFPKHHAVDQLLVQAAVTGGDSAQALALAQALQKAQPQSPEGYLLEGDLHMRAKAAARAVPAYRQAAVKAPAAGLAIKVVDAMHAAGEHEQAQRFATDWLRERPDDLRLRRYLADRMVSAGQHAAAKQAYLELLPRMPADPQLLNNLAWACHLSADPCAREHAEAAVRRAPNLPQALDTLAVILQRAGEHPRALALLEQAAALAPQQPQIAHHLAAALAHNGRRSDAKSRLQQLLDRSDHFEGRDEAKALLASLS